MSTNLKKSPVGEILFMAAENPVTDKKTGNEYYTLKLAFDVKKDKEWLDEVAQINSAKVVTQHTYRGKNEEAKKLLSQGKAFVEAKSNFRPTVFDANGNEMEQNPYFFNESTGKAQMIVQPYVGEKGGTINLVGIVIHLLNNPESDGTDKETRLSQLKALVAK